MSTSTPTRWLTPPAVAEQLGIDADRVVRLIRSGEIEAVDVSNRGSRRPRFRISPQALEAFLNRRRVVPPAPAVRRRRSSTAAVKEYF
jgi:excisionase family DNA binding protein